MKTLTKTLTVYRFAELSDDAKQRAKDDFSNAEGYSGALEFMETLKSLAAHFDGKLADWSIDWFGACRSRAEFDMPDMEPDEIQRRLDTLGAYDADTLRGNGDCKLTGVFCDEDAVDGFRLAFVKRGETDLNALMQSAFESWLRSALADCESQFTDENFSETAEANGWEFTEDGELYP